MPKKIPDFRTATEGERFMWRGEEKTIQPKAKGDAGAWACIRCQHLCAHNLEKDSHVSERVRKGTDKQPGGPKAEKGTQARHVLAWLSHTTGNFEVP
jgi:hypothetical protein